jgi:ABC-type uncharacterized transport system substrate-binding protein
MRIGVILLMFSLMLSACTMCGRVAPEVHAVVHERHTATNMILEVEWIFNKTFSAEALLSYDADQDLKIDKSELKTMKEALIKDIEQDSYLTFIKYIKDVTDYEKAPYYPFKVTKTDASFNDNQLRFYFTLKADLVPKEGHTLHLTFFDERFFLLFFLKEFTFEKDEGNMLHIFDNSASFSLTGGGH